MAETTYWNNNGKYENLNKALYSLIPESGPVVNPKKNRALEKFRKAANCYYDLYNNGLCNYAKSFYSVFGIRSADYRYNGLNRNFLYGQVFYDMIENKMNEIILAAAKEQMIRPDVEVQLNLI